MLLTEILDVNLGYLIDIKDPKSLSKVYDVDGEKLPGNECISKFIEETLENSSTEYETPETEKGAALFRLYIDDAGPSNVETPLAVGPNRYLTMRYKTKIRHGAALKYKLITKDTNLSDKDTWEAYIRPNVFFSLINNEKIYSKLKSVQLNDFLGQKLKKNNDESFTRYEYSFYDEERPDWADNSRLREIQFDKGFLILTIDMPVYEVKTPPKEEVEERSY